MTSFTPGQTLTASELNNAFAAVTPPVSAQLLGSNATPSPVAVAVGTGLSLSVGSLSASWQLALVTSLGSGLSLISGVLSATGGSGSVTSVATGAGLSGGPITTTGTVVANYQAGTLTSFGTGLTLSSGTLTPNYQAGVLTTFGSGLSLSSGTLAATGGGSGTVTNVATSGAGISGGPVTTTGTLTVEWNAGTVTALGTGLSISSGTLNASGGGGGIGTIEANGVSVTSSPAILGNVTAVNAPASAGFSFVNQGGATLANNADGSLTWSQPTATGTDILSFSHKAVPAGSWTLQANVHYLISSAPSIPIFGIDDGATAQFFVLIESGSDPDISLQVQHWTSFNSASGSGVDATIVASLPNPIDLRVVYNSSTPSLSFDYSMDGARSWITLFSASGSLFLTPANYLFGCDPNHTSAVAPARWTFNRLTIA